MKSVSADVVVPTPPGLPVSKSGHDADSWQDWGAKDWNAGALPVSKRGQAASSWQHWSSSGWNASAWNDRAWNDGGDNEQQDDMVHGHHAKPRKLE